MFSNSVCNTNLQTCECAQHFFEKGGKCVGGIGSQCTDDCPNVDYATCSDQTCQCSSTDRVPSGDWKKCLSGIIS